MKAMFKLILIFLVAISLRSCGTLEGTANYWEYDNARYYSCQGKVKLDSKTRNKLNFDSTLLIYNKTDTIIEAIKLDRSVLTYKYIGKAKNIKHTRDIVKNCLKKYCHYER